MPETAALNADVPLPLTKPVNVPTPVPPFGTVRMPVKAEVGIVGDAVTALDPLAYMYPVKPVTVMLWKASEVDPSIFCQALVVPLKMTQSPTDHSEMPFRVVVPATDTM